MVRPGLPGDLGGAVCAAIVDDQDLHRAKTGDFLGQIRQGGRQGGLLVEAGDLNHQFHADPCSS